ncbi:conjugal transfer TraD family protein (plasmid) [Blastomonas sp. RAC04]|nr:conjugal transfer TraD family protein [Blastomonas sp. RAC04]
MTTHHERRPGGNAVLSSFKEQATLADQLARTLAAHKRSIQARNRLLAHRARHDMRDWRVKRRERTRQLIELGGLIAKAELIDLTDDDRAVILGLLIEAAAKLKGESREQDLLLWRRRGARAFAQNQLADSR